MRFRVEIDHCRIQFGPSSVEYTRRRYELRTARLGTDTWYPAAVRIPAADSDDCELPYGLGRRRFLEGVSARRLEINGRAFFVVRAKHVATRGERQCVVDASYASSGCDGRLLSSTGHRTGSRTQIGEKLKSRDCRRHPRFLAFENGRRGRPSHLATGESPVRQAATRPGAVRQSLQARNERAHEWIGRLTDRCETAARHSGSLQSGEQGGVSAQRIRRVRARIPALMLPRNVDSREPRRDSGDWHTMRL